MLPRSRSIAAAVLLFIATPAEAQKRPVVPEDLYRLASVGSVELSPPGTHVAYVVTTVDEAANSRRSVVWLIDVADGRAAEARPVTTLPYASSAPVWSPDGTQLAFTMQRPDHASRVWFIRPADRGAEPYQIDGVTETPIWSPDGAWIAFTRAPDDEAARRRRGTAAEWIAPDAITTTVDSSRFDGRVITHLNYKRDGVFDVLPHPALRPKSQLFVVPSTGGEPTQLTDVPFSVGGVEWSPDGRMLLFTGNELEDDESSSEPTTAIYAVARSGGAARRLTHATGSHTSPRISRDGRRLAYLRTLEPAYSLRRIEVVDIAADGTFAGEPRSVTSEFDESPGAPQWSADGRALRFVASRHGSSHLYEVAVAGGPARQITSGERMVSSVSVAADDRVMAYAATSVMRPDEVFLARGDATGEVQLTTLNEAWLAEVELVPAERLTWTVGDGTEIEGWVLKPVGHDPARRYPLVLNIHGGPHAMYGHSFSHTFQLLAGAGFFVLYPNPRGSTGYGLEFMSAVRGVRGILDEEDFVAGVEAALARYPEVDRNRLGVMGGSYGGYMTHFLTARTDLFAAAASRAPISDWISQYGTSDTSHPDYGLYGPPWEQRERYLASSPFSYVENVRTPTLIVVGLHDARTPIGQSEMWYSALRKRGVPVEFVRYPRAGHGIREPWQQVDHAARALSWMKHWLIDQPRTQTTDTNGASARSR